jgi:hypothetical protein
MHCVLSRPSAAVTLVVALTTVCALGLPEGIGGRDSVVRLTRGGLQRIGCADTASHHEDAEALVEAASGRQLDAARCDGPPVVALPRTPPAAPVPLAHSVRPLRFAPPSRPPAPPGHAVSGRAPPAR